MKNHLLEEKEVILAQELITLEMRLLKTTLKQNITTEF